MVVIPFKNGNSSTVRKKERSDAENTCRNSLQKRKFFNLKVRQKCLSSVETSRNSLQKRKFFNG